MEVILLVFLAACVLTSASVPLFKRIAARTGYMDVPKSEQHKQHRQATPLLGGGAMFAGWALTLAGTILAAPYCARFCNAGDLTFGAAGPELAVLILCTVAAVVMGLIDDRHPLTAGTKFGIQFLIAAAAVAFGGLRISLFIPIPAVSYAISVLWIMFIFNAINFFDNMDGLAAGTAWIAFLLFSCIAAFNGQYFVAPFCACCAGAAFGFWLFNRHPASMFMGDAGSHFLGFLLAAVSIKVSYFNPAVTSTRFAVLIPLLILAVPIFDALAVVVIRLRNHKPIYVGDNNHISHRFVHMGFSRKNAVLMIHLLSLTIGIGALPILWGDWKICAILLIQAVVFLGILSIVQCTAAPVSGGDPQNRK